MDKLKNYNSWYLSSYFYIVLFLGQSSSSGVFDALSKKCAGRFDVCCKGNCKVQPKKNGEPSIKKERSLPQEIYCDLF